MPDVSLNSQWSLNSIREGVVYSVGPIKGLDVALPCNNWTCDNRVTMKECAVNIADMTAWRIEDMFRCSVDWFEMGNGHRCSLCTKTARTVGRKHDCNCLLHATGKCNKLVVPELVYGNGNALNCKLKQYTILPKWFKDVFFVQSADFNLNRMVTPLQQ